MNLIGVSVCLLVLLDMLMLPCGELSCLITLMPINKFASAFHDSCTLVYCNVPECKD